MTAIKATKSIPKTHTIRHTEIVDGHVVPQLLSPPCTCHQPASSVQPSAVTEMVDVVNSNTNELSILKLGDYARIVKGTFLNFMQ